MQTTDRPFAELWQSEALDEARQILVSLDEEILRNQIAITRIAAPSGEENERGRWMAERFRELGLEDVRIDAAGNVIGRRSGEAADPGDGGGERRPVVICAHLDTVFPQRTTLDVHRSGSRVRGPGIGDNARGLAVMLALARVIDGRSLRTRAPVDFVCTTGEEGAGNLRGAKALFAGAARDAIAAIALDGAGDERIVHRALGSYRYRIEFRGRGGHSWTSYGVPNPVHAAAIAAARMARLPIPTEPRTTLSVVRTGGGLSLNSIPDSAWLEVDLRSVSPAMLEQHDRTLREIVRVATLDENSRRSRGTPPLSSEVLLIGDRPSGETPIDHPLVEMAIEATRLIGRAPELATASTDSNVPISRGIPAIAIGAGGRGGDAHTEEEWFDNSYAQAGVARALGIIVGAAGLA
ncbi:MAG TPA: M20/M25/M40 family metallo-hydrolase [Gemmatimonadaceae bacterium]|jgi:acetylornithine deacetylase/succinyl-diaminopimelate desuccinylase-like protein|nr:M20/M25/M40 family metallo-hydrolase [Gemmatimonadaceae bacterium]